MRRLALFSVLAVLATRGFAQVTVEVVFDQEQFLRNESLPLRVRIVNYSGQTLHLGEHPDWLSFIVEGTTGEPLARTGSLPETTPISLENSKVASVKLDLMPYYDLGVTGRYRVTAMVRVPQLRETISSKPRNFDIVSGTVFWEQEFGVPSTGVPEVRKYALQQATFLKQLRLYVRITPADESKTLRVVALGPLVSFARPEAQLDKLSNLHVLYQSSAKTFLYAVVTPQGDLIVRQTHEYMTTRPHLHRDAKDQIAVAGGERIYYPTDIPPSEPIKVPLLGTDASLTNLLATNSVSSTNPPTSPVPSPTAPSHDGSSTNTPATPLPPAKIRRAD